ncbi:MAG: OprO/OprP family phosphate-selective porin [Nitrospira sp.]|nr:OprO/OprP family phosphate-selective porin [Nitrospira sp.]MCP9464028.1 OprO/OprP family phosphate-selective porin [Nitrospira sp.]
MVWVQTRGKHWHWWGVCLGLFLITSWGGSRPAWAGHLEDLLLEKGQITIDEWVELKAEEERRESKKQEESRSVGDTPVTAKWYEKISVRGYTQIRWNRLGQPNGALVSAQGDRSIGDNSGFFLRRARLILSGQPHDRLFIYLQPDFASSVTGGNHVVQLRDWYADIFLTEDKEWRIRAGQSKVPYGFENMQSSQNRLALDRADALNSAVLNERDFGFFLYYAPSHVRARFRKLVESGLKGSGDYGMLGVGVYNGQTANQVELNDNKHVILRAAYPFELPNGQIVELGASAYHGKFVISKTSIVPEGGGAAVTPAGPTTFLDERVGAYFMIYPQPFGLQGEYTFGHGPRLSEDRRSISTRPLYGGYIQAMYNYKCPAYCLSFWPFIRYQEYLGGRKHEPNAPSHRVRELEIGAELQINPNLELTASYSWTDRTSSVATGPEPYKSQAGNLIRFQLQFNY